MELVRPPGRGDGVLLAHGSKHAGYVLHVRDGRLVYEQSLVPWSERIESQERLPDGPITVRYVQTMTARPSTPASSTRRRSFRIISTSNPFSGSSKTSTRGLPVKAAASPNFLRIPSE